MLCTGLLLLAQLCYNGGKTKNKITRVTSKTAYNVTAMAVFSVLIVAACTFYVVADDGGKNLTLFEDFDQDGLSNGEEHTYGTNPYLADTDGDGYSDGVEVQSGFNPLKPAPGDKIVATQQAMDITPIESSSTVTQRISDSVVSYLSDRQNDPDSMTSEDFAEMISKTVEREVSFSKPDPIDLESINVKKQEYAKLSDRERKEQIKKDTLEYMTSLSYVFINSFPQGYFDRAPEEVQKELFGYVAEYSTSLKSYSYFEDMASRSIEAQKQMARLTVPENMLDIHAEALYLLRYMQDIYDQGDYKKVETDIAPLIATLAQVQALLQKSMELQTKLEERLTAYDIPIDSFLQL